MQYAFTINAVGSYTIYKHSQKDNSKNPGEFNREVVATAYAEGMATRIVRLLNEEGCGQ